MIALGKWSLSPHTHFTGVALRDGYRGPELDIEKPPGFGSDEEYVLEVERLANRILGPYGMREHKFALSRLGGAVPVNRAFNAMKVRYSVRPDPRARKGSASGSAAWPGTSADIVVPRGRGRSRGRGRGRGRGLTSTAAWERRKKRSLEQSQAREHGDVQVGRLICKPLKRSKKAVAELFRRYVVSSTEIVVSV